MLNAAPGREYTPAPESAARCLSAEALKARSGTPHPAPEAFRFGFRASQLVEARERRTRGHARQTVAYERGVDEESVLTEHIREPAAVDIEDSAILLEAHPSMQHHRDQTFARFLRERRRRIESVSHLRRVDAEQPHATESRNADRVAVGDGGDDDGIGSLESRARRECVRNCHGRREHGGQNLHTHLHLARDRAKCRYALCNRLAALKSYCSPTSTGLTVV